MISKDQITNIFVVVDEFMLEFESHLSTHLIGNKPK